MLSSGDFRIYMRQLAGWVWNEQGAAHSFGLSLQEETITEVLLLEMARTLTPLGLKQYMFNKREEGGRTSTIKREGLNGQIIETTKVETEAEGADWEWFVDGLDGCSAMFRIQEKKLTKDKVIKSGRYGSFIPGEKQIDDLIRRARGGNPIYVLYNHKDVLDNSLFGASRQPDYFGRSCWGCAVTTAQFMKRAPDNRLSTIQPNSVPWHRFFSIGRPCRPAAAMREIGEGLELSAADRPQEFVPAERRPEWVGQLIDGESDLTGYLVEHSLQGVAYLDFSSMAGD